MGMGGVVKPFVDRKLTLGTLKELWKHSVIFRRGVLSFDKKLYFFERCLFTKWKERRGPCVFCLLLCKHCLLNFPSCALSWSFYPVCSSVGQGNTKI